MIERILWYIKYLALNSYKYMFNLFIKFQITNII